MYQMYQMYQKYQKYQMYQGSKQPKVYVTKIPSDSFSRFLKPKINIFVFSQSILQARQKRSWDVYNRINTNTNTKYLILKPMAHG